MRISTKEQGIRNLLTGKAGEYAVASKLALLGIPVSFAEVDLGVDLYAYNGCRIQVKSAHLTTVRNGRNYVFPLPKTKRRANSDNTSHLVKRPNFSEICDAVVFWGIEEDRFWVVSSKLVDRSTGLSLGDSDPDRFVGDISDMRDMMSLGYSLTEIAKKYGTYATSVKQFLDSGKDYQEPSITSQVRKCEGNWDLILNFQTDRKIYTSSDIKEDSSAK